MDVILLDEIQDLIGATNATGGSTTAGTVMAKLNALLTSWTSTRAGYVDRLANSTYGLDKIKADTTTNNTGSKTGILSQKLSYLISLLENTTYGLSAIKTTVSSSKVYKPSSSVLSTVLSSEVKLSGGKYDSSNTRYANVLYFGKFTPQYDGVVKIVVSLKPGEYSSYYGNRIGTFMALYSWDSLMSGGTYNGNLYTLLGILEEGTVGNLINTTLSIGATGSGTVTLYKTGAYATGTTSYTSHTFYVPVSAGKTIYFTSHPQVFNNDYAYMYHVMCNSIKIYATAS